MSRLNPVDRVELELTDDRRLVVNSLGQRFCCLRTRKGGYYFVRVERVHPGQIAVSLPPHLGLFELQKGWVRIYKRKGD